MTRAVISHVAEEVARSLSFARTRGSSAFVTTALSYPNGSGIIVRIDECEDGYIVSDDGHSAFLAETMNALGVFRRVAADAAARSGVSFNGGTLFMDHVTRQGLVSASVAVANTASRAAERVAHAVNQQRARQSRDLFDVRLKEVFGDQISFNVPVIGATTREWEFDAGLTNKGQIAAVFDLVSPVFFAVASANMKIMDVRGAMEDIAITVALSDYGRTEPSLRAILSHVADQVIDANSDVSQYAALPRAGWRSAPISAH